MDFRFFSTHQDRVWHMCITILVLKISTFCFKSQNRPFQMKFVLFKGASLKACEGILFCRPTGSCFSSPLSFLMENVTGGKTGLKTSCGLRDGSACKSPCSARLTHELDPRIPGRWREPTSALPHPSWVHAPIH